jgi:hypothetical protein
MILKRVGVLSAAKIAGALYASMGLIIGCIIAVISALGAGFAAATQTSGAPGWMTALFGVGAVILLPILYGILGLVGGAIGAALYNLFSGLVGGLELEMQTSPNS